MDTPSGEQWMYLSRVRESVPWELDTQGSAPFPRPRCRVGEGNAASGEARLTPCVELVDNGYARPQDPSFEHMIIPSRPVWGRRIRTAAVLTVVLVKGAAARSGRRLARLADIRKLLERENPVLAASIPR